MSLWTADIQQNGTFDQLIGRFPAGVIDRHSHVLVSICEISQPAGEPLDFPFIGGATMTIHNICPRDDDQLQVRISIGFDRPLNCRLWITISD
jgi:hypothetical protein